MLSKNLWTYLSTLRPLGWVREQAQQWTSVFARDSDAAEQTLYAVPQ
jgi:hypothetical protein